MARVDYEADHVLVADKPWNRTGDSTPYGDQRAYSYEADKSKSQEKRRGWNINEADVTKNLSKVEGND